MKQVFNLILFAITIIFLSSCDNAFNSSKPSASTIAKRFEFELHDYMASESFNVTAIDNFRTAEDPLIKGKYKAKVLLQEKLFIHQDTLLDTLIIKQTFPKDKEFAVTGHFTAELSNENWVINFGSISYSPALHGQPLTRWSTQEYAIENSKEAHALIQRDKDTKLAAQKRAEEEKARLIALKEKQEKELAVQRKAAKISAEKKQKQFRNSITGTWESLTPVLNSNGSIYTDSVCSGDVGASGTKFELTIPSGTFDTAEASLKVYLVDNDTSFKKVISPVKANAESESLILSVPKIKLMCKGRWGTRIVFRASGRPLEGKIVNGHLKLSNSKGRNITLKKVTNK